MSKLSSIALTMALCQSGVFLCTVQAQIRIHAGGAAYTDAVGNSWASDYGYSGSSVYSAPSPVIHTATSALYASTRWSSGNLSYTFTVPNGNYIVRLMYAELYFNSAGSRVFNVAVNGVSVETNFDIFAAAGGSLMAVDRRYAASVTKGQLSILLSTKIQNPAINGIEIEPVSGSIVTLNPGANLNAAVSQNPPGTTFLIKSGVYREQQILTQPYDSFFGETGTVLNGSELLTSFTQSGNVWIVYGQTQQGPRLGDCGSTTPLCIYPEDLYVDNAVVPRAASLGSLQPGQWYFDYGSATIYLAINPAGHVVETGVTQSAFAGVAGNVTICGFTVEKYANSSQIGAIGDVVPGQNWVIYNNEVRLNHSTGIIVESQSQIWQNYIHNNGMVGVFGIGAGIYLCSNEIAWNNYAGYDPVLVGGAKFLQTQNLSATWNYVHDNSSSGLWTDTDNINTLYDSNTLVNNAYGGIQHEISYAAVIRNNRLKGNGGAPNWAWGSQILIQNSQNVQVYNNTIMSTATNGSGITVISQNRGTGAYGYYIATNNAIYNNDISYQAGSTGISGVVCDYPQDLPTVANAANNTFNWNSYHASNPAGYLFRFNYIDQINWSSWQGVGEDVNSSLDTAVPSFFYALSSWTGQWE